MRTSGRVKNVFETGLINNTKKTMLAERNVRILKGGPFSASSGCTKISDDIRKEGRKKRRTT